MAALLALPVLVLFFQAVLAWLPLRQNNPVSGPRPRVAVLIPAHNEAAVIEATLRTLLPQLQPGDRVLVAADKL